jgi:ribosomal protein L37AE/L43A
MEARGLQSGGEISARGGAAAAVQIEPRRPVWAVAEVSWADPAGRCVRARATIVDISTSGACIRVKNQIDVGSRLTIKWHREQFSATARNCRSDGMDYLLGVRRDSSPPVEVSPISSAPQRSAAVVVSAPGSTRSSSSIPVREVRKPLNLPDVRATPAPRKTPQPAFAQKDPKTLDNKLPQISASEPHGALARREAARQERKVMQPKRFFPHFWRRQHEADAPPQIAPKEAPVNKPTTARSAETTSDPPSRLLSYEDIYHAAGIMNPRSGYGIRKVVEMLNSERIRDLSKDIQRASVLMALDAAGASVEELLEDATRREQALNNYEQGQRKQLEEFETRKAQENTQIEAEMHRITAHYAERVQQNKDEVAKHKEALHNWQMAKQHESQRISEVIELCGKHGAVAAGGGAMAAAAGTGTSQSSGKPSA